MVDNTTSAAKKLIKEFEGLHLESYHCPAGIKTIGYGHVITAHDTLPASITKGQAEKILEDDVHIARAALYRYCRIPLNTNQQAALISFIFNLGAGAFQSSTLRQKLNRGEYFEASNQLLKWVYARGIKLRGLERRRIAERNLFLTEVADNKNHIMPFTIKTATKAATKAASKSLYTQIKAII